MRRVGSPAGMSPTVAPCARPRGAAGAAPRWVLRPRTRPAHGISRACPPVKTPTKPCTNPRLRVLVIVWCLLVSVARQIGVGVVVWIRRRIVGVRRIDCFVRAIMRMLMGVWMLVRVSVRMAVPHVAVGMEVVMNVFMRMHMFMRVRLNRLVDLGHRGPPYGGVSANDGARGWSEGRAGPCCRQVRLPRPRESIAARSSRQCTGHELGLLSASCAPGTSHPGLPQIKPVRKMF